METQEKTKQKRSVRIREQKNALKAHKEQNAGKLGEVKSSLNNIPTSPRKMRLVADMVRGVQVDKALNILKFSTKAASKTLEKLLLSAIANWQQANEDVKLEEANLYIKQISVNEGRMLKRLRPAPQGRGYRVRKRSNHVTILLDSASAS
ncbi:MAG TPA: 50S ribosomal protein L22 [Microscillaceae bacterium]|jgi:large subunit ribosomal protein L22|nr:50S ribosomal protein L22 [Microscillaceae bacterium]